MTLSNIHFDCRISGAYKAFFFSQQLQTVCEFASFLFLCRMNLQLLVYSQFRLKSTSSVPIGSEG